MLEADLKTLLRRVRTGKMSEADALARLRDLPFEDLGHTKVDHHRGLRCGHVEVVFGAGKTSGQIVDIARALRRRDAPVLVTRVDAAQATAFLTAFPDGEHHEAARALTLGALPRPMGLVMVLIGLSLLGELPWWVTAVIMVREIGVTALRLVVIRHGVMPASRGGKVKTLLQSVAIGLLVLPTQGRVTTAALVVMGVAVVVTVVTGIDYVLRAVRLRRTSARSRLKRARRT